MLRTTDGYTFRKNDNSSKSSSLLTRRKNNRFSGINIRRDFLGQNYISLSDIITTSNMKYNIQHTYITMFHSVHTSEKTSVLISLHDFMFLSNILHSIQMYTESAGEKIEFC